MTGDPTKAQLALKPKCDECRNPVRSNGWIYNGEKLCGKCLTTPPEIRQREIYGCRSLHFMSTPQQIEAAHVEATFQDRTRMSAAEFRKRHIRPVPRSV